MAQRSDYRRYSAGSGFDTDAIITRGYEDILGRKPDVAGMRSYRRHIIEDGWSEQDVREALRQSPEYRSTTRRTTSADRIVRRAYQDVLQREPDPNGLDTYRRAILDHGWDEQDVRQALRRSDEHRGLRDELPGVVLAADPRPAVRAAYLAVLHREPDANGLHDYGARVVQDHWTQANIEKALRESPEYRSKGIAEPAPPPAAAVSAAPGTAGHGRSAGSASRPRPASRRGAPSVTRSRAHDLGVGGGGVSS